jgi:hypothetical protein
MVLFREYLSKNSVIDSHQPKMAKVDKPHKKLLLQLFVEQSGSLNVND